MTSSRAHMNSVERGPRRKLKGLVGGTGAEPIPGPSRFGMLGALGAGLASPRGPESRVWTVPSPPLLFQLAHCQQPEGQRKRSLTPKSLGAAWDPCSRGCLPRVEAGPSAPPGGSKPGPAWARAGSAPGLPTGLRVLSSRGPQCISVSPMMQGLNIRLLLGPIKEAEDAILVYFLSQIPRETFK